jgi:hypothetical protein
MYTSLEIKYERKETINTAVYLGEGNAALHVG